VVEYLRQLLLVKFNNAGQVDATAEMRAVMGKHAQGFTVSELLRVLKAFNTAATEGRLSWQPALPLEMAFVEAITEPAAVPAPQAAMETQGSKPPPAAARPTPKAAPPPPAAAPTAAVESSPAEGNESALGRKINDQWRQIMAWVKPKDANAAGLLNSVRTRHLQDNVLTLGFSSDTLKSQMEKPEKIELVQEALKQTFGQEFRVRCTTVSAQRSAPPPNVEHDGMVALAVRDLGGEIVDIQ
jgi:DNA polymerase-3 subunit gamma/tau